MLASFSAFCLDCRSPARAVQRESTSPLARVNRRRIATLLHLPSMGNRGRTSNTSFAVVVLETGSATAMLGSRNPDEVHVYTSGTLRPGHIPTFPRSWRRARPVLPVRTRPQPHD